MANQTRFWLHSAVTPFGRSGAIPRREHFANALLAVGLALLLMFLFDPWAKMSQNPYLLFFGAVVMSAWRSGFWGGLMATGLSAIVSQYFFREPRYSLALDLPSIVSLLLFILECTIISGICDSLRQRNQQLDRSLSQLKSSDDRYRRILETAGEGIWIIDAHLRTEYVNQRLTEILGYSAVEMMGKSIFEFISPEFQKVAWQQIKRHKQGLQEQFDFCYQHKDGSQVWAIVSTNPMFDDQGKFSGALGMVTDITDRKRQEADRKQVEAALRQSETILNAFLASSPIGMAFLDHNLRYRYANEALAAINGIPLADHLDHTFAELLPDWDAQITPILQNIIASQQPLLNVEISGETYPAGVHRHTLVNYFPVCLADGQVLGVGVTAMDITELKQAEAALRQREEQFRQLADAMPQIVWIADATGKAQYLNQQWFDYTGLPSQQGYNPDQIASVIHPEDQANNLEQWEKAVATGSTYQAEFRLRRGSDGCYRWFLGRSVPIFDDQGDVIHWYGTSTDIDDRKQSEVALRRSEDRYRTLANAVPQLLWVNNADGKVEFFNQRWQEYTGIEDLQLGVGLWANVLHPEDFPTTAEKRTQAIQSRKAYEVECRLKRYDQTYRWHLARVVPLKDDAGQVLHWFGTAMDIQDLKQAQEDLQQSEAIAKARAAELETFMETVPAAVWIAHDPQCHHMTANRAAYELVSLPSGAVATATPADGNYPFPFKIQQDGQDIPLEELPMQRAGRTGEDVEEECDFVFPNGEVRAIWGRAVPLRQEDGQIRGVIGAFLDMSDRKKAEQERERLLERERLAREAAESANRIKDEFLAVLSHELRSPLNPILGWAKLLRTRKFDATATDRALETIERNANLQTQLIDDLLDVSRILRGKMTLTVSPINLGSTIQAALETVQLAAEVKNIQIQTQLATEGIYISGDGGRLQQIIWNLLSNAIKFTSSGGQVEIRLKTLGTLAQIQVKDTGKGIKPEFLPYVFDYFRQEDGTTTRKFGGLGLGLAIVRHLTELHGGTVQAESGGEGQGATFTVQLPRLITAIKPESRANLAAEALDLNSLRILVVDDEADMRILAETLLSSYGAEVKVAASAAAALHLLNEFQPQLLISDIGMPDMDGYMLMRLIRRRSPERGGLIPAIALTAYAGEFDQKQALAAGFQKHVVKPVDPSYLAQIIVSLMEHSQESLTTATPQSPTPQSEESKSE